MAGELVLVTGATGFIAAHIILELVNKGYRVRGTVRSLKNASKYDYLYEVCGDTERTKLEFVEGDLQSSPEVWDEIVKDCVFVLHTAAPVLLTVKDVQKELVEPMVSGVTNLFSACDRSSAAKRIVFTSSASTLSDDFPEWKTKVYTGQDWNTRSSPKRNPYMYAKTVAERCAHDFVRDKKLALACVLPYQVVGPALGPHAKVPETMDMPMRGALDGEMYKVNFIFSLIDVRDVAKVHVAAMERLVVPQEPIREVPRYVLATPPIKFSDLILLLAKAAPERKKNLPKANVPGFLVLLYSKFTMPKGVYNYVKANLGHAVRVDSSNVAKELGVEFRSTEETVTDSVAWMKERKLLKSRG